MSFTLFLDAETPAFASRSPVIKANDRIEVESAARLLTEARQLHSRAKDEYEQCREAAQAEGYQAGIVAAQEQIQAMLTDLSLKFEAFSDERRDDVAKAAYAAVEAIIGEMPDDTKLTGLVHASLSRIDGEAPMTIEVGTASADRLAAHLKNMTHISIVGDNALGATDVRITSGQGKIIADLGLQMDALAQRWGVKE